MRQTRSGNPTFPGWKFESPRLGIHLLTRERLLGRVEQCLGRAHSGGDILLVSAPAGYGKSTLLAEWALRTPVPVVWYHLDHSDQDPATFLRGIAHALRLRFPRPRWSVETMLDHLRADVLSEADLTRASAMLATDIEQHIAKPVALILTGVAELGSKSAGLGLLDRLLSRPKDHLRVALEWREAPSLRFSSLLAEQRLSAIGSDDLCLTDAELDALLTLAGASDDRNYRDQIRRLCTGWVAGAVLAVGAMMPLSSPVPPGTLDNAAVVDYLAHQVIDVLPPALGSFAGEASVLSYMTPALCSRLLGLPNRTARERLGALERSTGFLSRSGHRPQELVYRFQPLLRQALLARLEGLPGGKARRRALHLKAARLLQEAEDYEEAVRHYAQAGGVEEIADLIEEVESDYLRASRGLLLARWLDLLPRSVYRRRPHLQLLRAELWRHSGKHHQALQLVERLHRHLTSGLAGDGPTCQWTAHALVISAEVLHDLARYGESECASLRALSTLHQLSADGELADAAQEALYVRAYETLAATVLLTRGPEAAEPHLRACERYSLDSGDLWRVGRHHYQRSKILIREGNFAGAESAAIAALLAAEEAHDEICAVASRLNLGAIKMRRGRPNEAREELETALADARAVGYTLGEAYALGNLGDLALSSGAYPHAIQFCTRALEVLGATEDTHARLMTSSGLGYALALAGRPEEATTLLTPLVARSRGSSASRKKETGSADDVVLALSLGFAYLRQGFWHYAEELFVRAERDAGLHGQTLKGAQAHLFLAALRLEEGKGPEAESELLLALDRALAVQDALALAVEIRRVPEAWSLLDHLDHPLAADLMRAVRYSWPGSFEATEPATLAASSAPLGEVTGKQGGDIRIYMFGPSRVLVGTTPVTRWKKPAARDLLLYLVHQQGSASRETILAALWPDIDPEISDGWFRQARYHLQHTLKRDCLVQEESGFWRLELDCQVDVTLAKRLLDEGKRLVEGGEETAGADCLRQALTLWHGPYLDDLYVDWTARRRDELYQLRLGLLEQLAGLELQAGAPDKAAQLYQQILATEPYCENAHRGLMRCFVARGEPSRAIQHFRTYYSLLRDDLDTSPDQETLGLCQAILREMQTTSQAFAGVLSLSPIHA